MDFNTLVFGEFLTLGAVALILGAVILITGIKLMEYKQLLKAKETIIAGNERAIEKLTQLLDEALGE